MSKLLELSPRSSDKFGNHLEIEPIVCHLTYASQKRQCISFSAHEMHGTSAFTSTRRIALWCCLSMKSLRSRRSTGPSLACRSKRAAIDVKSGTVIGNCMPCSNQLPLNAVTARHPQSDNASFSFACGLRVFVFLCVLPTYSPGKFALRT